MKRILENKKEILPVLVILLMLAIGFYFYPSMPDKMPSHWNFEGKVDSYSSKAVALFAMPALVLLIYLLLSAVTALSMKKEKNDNSKYLYATKVVVVLFMFAIYVAMIVAAKNYVFNMGRLVLVLMAALFFFISYVMRKVKRNLFIGIRTPWTLTSDFVWEKTHKAGSILLMLIAIAFLAMLFVSTTWQMIIFVVSIVLLLVFSFLYSYYLYKVEEKSKNKKTGKKKKANKRK